jgi:hypothetical protein
MLTTGCPRQPLPNMLVYWGLKILPLNYGDWSTTGKSPQHNKFERPKKYLHCQIDYNVFPQLNRMLNCKENTHKP